MCGGFLVFFVEEIRKYRLIKIILNVFIFFIIKGRNIIVELLRKREIVFLCLGIVFKIYLYYIWGFC